MKMYLEKTVASLSPMVKLGFLIKSQNGHKRLPPLDGVAENNVEAQSVQASDELRNALAFLYAKREELMGEWHAADEYNGRTREIKARTLCNSLMCPPDTAVTEWQHTVMSADKKTLVFETVQQPNDVPFGSYFEVHSRW